MTTCEDRRNQTSILIRGRENHFPPKPDGQRDRHTDGHQYLQSSFAIKTSSYTTYTISIPVVSRACIFINQIFKMIQFIKINKIQTGQIIENFLQCVTNVENCITEKKYYVTSNAQKEIVIHNEFIFVQKKILGY